MATSARRSSVPASVHSADWAAYAHALHAIEAAGGLVSAKEIAAEWGITPQAVGQRITRGLFPDPVKTMGRTRLYLRVQLEPFRPPR